MDWLWNMQVPQGVISLLPDTNPTSLDSIPFAALSSWVWVWLCLQPEDRAHDPVLTNQTTIPV